MAIPVPMVPAPITATDATLRGLTPSGRPVTRPAARSAKNTCRRAADTGPSISCLNRRPSSAKPASMERVAPYSTASMIEIGAGYSLKAVLAVFRANWQSACRSGSFTLRSRARGSGLPSRSAAAEASATATAAPIRSASTTLSNSGDLANRATGNGSPDNITLSAPSTPIRRGRRCVPPAPGSRPSFTSGRPIRAVASATRWWQLIASSRPPPSAMPSIAATTGLWRSSSKELRVHKDGPRIISGVPNSRMSAPALKVPLPPTSTMPSTAGSAAARCKAASISIRNA